MVFLDLIILQPTLFLLSFFPLAALASFPRRGLSYNHPQYIQNWNGKNSQVNWAYNWDSSMDESFPKFLEFIPMLWGTGNDHTGQWVSNANSALARGSGHFLAFNEPDGCNNGQSCISPQDAVNAYRQYMMPFAGKASLGAPAVTNGPSGLPWLKQFLSLCTGCQIDFVPIHWYDSATNQAYFYDYLQQTHDAAGGRQIWVTEFNGSGSLDQQTSFLQQVMKWMDGQDWIMRYAWFYSDPGTTMGAPIVDDNGNPTQLGNVYAYTTS